MKKIFFVLTVPFLIAACGKMESVLMYDDISFGEYVSGSILTDSGNCYEVVESCAADDKWKTALRCIFDCDILSKISDNKYTVRLNDYAVVTTVRALKKSEATEAEFGTDGALMSKIWMSGPGANILVQYTVLKDSETVHDINLVLDEERSTNNQLFFVLTHNGHGESYDNEDVNPSNLGIEARYYTFDLRDLTANLTGTYTLTFEYEWFVSSGGELTRDKETASVSGVVSF